MVQQQGRIQGGGGAHPARAPPKIGKKYDFLAQNCDLSHEIPPKCSRLPPQLEKIKFFGVKSWFFTRNTQKMFAPPSARRIFFKCAPLTLNPGSAPEQLCTTCSTSNIINNDLWLKLYVHCHNFFHLQKVQDGEGFSIGVDQWMLGNNRILNQ